MQRILVGFGVGGGITFGLFVLMAFLVKSEMEPPPKDENRVIEFVTVKADDEIKTRTRNVPKPPPPPKNPPPPRVRRVAKVQKPIKNASLNLSKLDVDVNAGTYMGQVGDGMGDGDAIPLVVIEPQYPRKAAMDGTVGWVRFEFTVSTDGSPKDIRLLDSKPKRVFNRASKKAIRKWKFKPKIVDGKAVEQPNMRYTMEFKLAQ